MRYIIYLPSRLVSSCANYTLKITQKPSYELICSVLTIIVGVGAVCFRASTISIIPVLIAMFSNFVLPMRNVLTKKIMLSDSAAPNASNAANYPDV